MVQALPLSRIRMTSAPGPQVSPVRPFAFAFAMGATPMQGIEIVPGTITSIEVVDGAPCAERPNDWFARRVPRIPPVTGPLRVTGVRRGDILAIELLDLSVESSMADERTLITVAVSGGEYGSPKTLQASVPCGGVVHIPALETGGLLSVGPILSRQVQGEAEQWDTIAAHVAVRCTVARSGHG